MGIIQNLINLFSGSKGSKLETEFDEFPELAYSGIKTMPEGFSKDMNLGKVAVALSKAKLHEKAIEAIESINEISVRSVYMMQLDIDTVNLYNEIDDDKED